MVGLWCLLGPHLVVRLIRRRRRSVGPAPAWAAVPGSTRQRFALSAAALGLILLGLAGLPAASGTSFARDPLLNAALSPLEALRYAHAAEASMPDPPVDTHLVRSGSGKPRNVVLVFLESVRDVSTTLADPDLGTTPYLSQLAKTSLVAENAYTVVPHTSKALTAGNCGVTPPLDMSVTESKPNGINGRCLPALLSEQGYASAFFQSATEHYDDRRELVRNFGYDSFYPVDVLDKTGYVESNYFGWEDDILLRPSRTWLTAHRDQPFVTGYLTVTSHHDYRVPSTIDTEHLSDDPELNKYLNTVRYGDRFVQRLIQQYKDLGLYENTVFVIMADHGEGFGEHGVRQHDSTIYTEGVKIPMIVHDPQNPNRAGSTQPVQLTSVLPTVVDELGFRVTGGSYPADLVDRAVRRRSAGDRTDPARLLRRQPVPGVHRRHQEVHLPLRPAARRVLRPRHRSRRAAQHHQRPGPGQDRRASAPTCCAGAPKSVPRRPAAADPSAKPANPGRAEASARQRGSTRNTGINRSVRVWYSAYDG